MLTVSVSVAAGVAAVTSAFPRSIPYRVLLGVLAVAAIAVGNLRGCGSPAKLFAAPDVFFVRESSAMLVYGLVAPCWIFLPEAPYERHPPGLEGVVGLFLSPARVLVGCAALTGVEAVSNGVHALKPPEGRNAQTVMTWLGAISIVLFLGITYLAYDFGLVPGEARPSSRRSPVACSGRACSTTPSSSARC